MAMFNGINFPLRPISDVQPFTYRDSRTFLDLFEQFREYLNNTVITGVNDAVKGLIENYQAAIDKFQELYGEDVERLENLIAQFKTDTQAIVDTINNKSGMIDVQHINLSANYTLNLNNTWPKNLPILYVITQDSTGGRSLTLGNDIIGSPIQGSPYINSAPLSVTYLYLIPIGGNGTFRAVTSDDEFASAFSDSNSNTSTLINNAINVAKNATTNQINDVNNDLSTKIASNTTSINNTRNLVISNDSAMLARTEIANKIINGKNTGDMFARLRTGIENYSSTNTRIVVFGDSIAYGRGLDYPETSFVNRMACRCGVNKAKDLLSGTINNGMQWFNASISGITSAGYFTGAMQNKLLLINPDYVIHEIGTNDYYNNIDPNQYKSNVKNAIQFVESNFPNCINVLVNVEQRGDVTFNYPYKAYGDKLREIVAENTAKRVLFDFTDAANAYGTQFSTDGFNLMQDDHVHPNIRGHKTLADFLCMNMGIPTESVMANDFIENKALPNDDDFSATTSTNVFTYNILPVRYPRMAIVRAVVYAKNATGTWDLRVYNNNNYSGARIKDGESTFCGRLQYIPPFTSGSINVAVSNRTPGSVTLEGGPTFNYSIMELKAI